MYSFSEQLGRERSADLLRQAALARRASEARGERWVRLEHEPKRRRVSLRRLARLAKESSC